MTYQICFIKLPNLIKESFYMKYQDLSTHRGIVALVDINVAHPDVGIKVV